MRKPSTTIRISEEAREILKTLADHLGISQAAVMEIALRKLHKQEIKTMTSQTELTYRIPTNEDYYTQDAAEEYLIAGLLDNQAVKIAAYLDEHFPGMAYEIEFVPETQSYNNRSKANSEQAEQALEAVENYVETHWYNWWPEPTA